MNFQTVKGMRDFMPEDMIVRNMIFDTAKRVLEKYGFRSLDTPALEYEETLTLKSGEDVKKELYSFKDKAGRSIGLRFDLTVPASRVLANNLDIPLPFKRYQFGKVWRYGEIKKGRYREFYQFDVDTYGSNSLLADAEIIVAVLEVYKELGLKVIMKINSRKILSRIMEFAGIPKRLESDVFTSIDKLGKIGLNGVKKELFERGVGDESCAKVLKLLKIKGLDELRKVFGSDEGVRELEELVSYLKAFRVKNFVVDFSLARGLDYYTGPVFEASCKDINVSVGGGGRYDKLIGLLSGRDLPATGFSLGVEPVFELMKNSSLKKRNGYFIAVAGQVSESKVLSLAQKLRSFGLLVETGLMDRSLRKQLDYASKKGLRFAVIVGAEELKKGLVAIKDLESGRQRKTRREKFLEKVKKTSF